MNSGGTAHGAALGSSRNRGVAILVVSLLAAVAGLSPRSAEASTPAPASTGWYVTSQERSAGVELLSIRRDEPLARGQVAVLPRSGLYRLRTVLASDQLVGGSRDRTSTLCARVHCHAAINGDRWVLSGHDAGRLAGAVAVGGELIATQPLPPAAPAAHLLVGEGGSMDGTIAVPIPVDPEVRAGAQEIPVAVNRQPLPGGTSVMTRRYSYETRTPAGTVEYVLSRLAGPGEEQVPLVPVTRRAGSGPIPESSIVVAVNGNEAGGQEAVARADAWWSEAVAAGAATYEPGLNGHREVIGGSPLLLDGSSYGFPTDKGDGRQPRSVIGWNDTHVWLVTVDGRRPGWSDGLTLVETAQLMRWLGATDALNLDGGGSTSFVGFGELRNRPSDGAERAVASALVIMPPENQVGPPPPARSIDPACPPGGVSAETFPDTVGNVHVEAITCMAWWGITKGTADGTYQPARSVRRDQMAAFLARYLSLSGVSLPADPPDAFPDDDRSIHEPWIDALAAMGVIGGRVDGDYDPADGVTRGQMATFLARAIPHVTGADLAHTTDFFADDSGDVHEPNINRVTEVGISGGTADGQYRPGSPVRRDQMGSFLARALGLAVEAGATAPPA